MNYFTPVNNDNANKNDKNKSNTMSEEKMNAIIPANTTESTNPSLKRNLKLEFNNTMLPNTSGILSKRTKLSLPSASLSLNIPSVLSSPDLKKLHLTSPELERYIKQISSTQTPTPNQVMFSSNVTDEQEMYAKGFIKALEELKAADAAVAANNNNNNSNNTDDPNMLFINESSRSDDFDMSTRCSSNSSSNTYTTLDSSNNIPIGFNLSNNSSNFEVNSSDGSLQIKEEPISSSLSMTSSPPMSPINMEDQERSKLERKRQRNRVAASKCRKRKLERIAKLEEKVTQLKGENTDLANMARQLRKDICTLKEQVMEHAKQGCEILIISNDYNIKGYSNV